MRILVVSSWPSPDAPERGIFVRRQVEALRRLGHEVEVAPLTDLRTGTFRTPLKYISLARHGRRLARRFGPQVVHGHFLLPTGYVARLIAHRLRLPYVVTAHGTDVRNAEQLYGVRVRTESVVRDAAAVIAVSEELADRLRELYPGLQVVVGDMGVDVTTFHPLAGRAPSGHGSEAARQRFVSVANLLPNKNHERLLRALATLPDASLVCIGEGPERERLTALVRELGVRAELPGRWAPEDLPRWYAEASAACLVSLDEGFGLSAIEALACGCPVVVSGTAPISHLVQDGVHGAVVDPTDVHDIARGLAAAAQLPHLTAKDVEPIVRGRTTDDRARELVEVLERAVGGSG